MANIRDFFHGFFGLHRDRRGMERPPEERYEDEFHQPRSERDWTFG